MQSSGTCRRAGPGSASHADQEQQRVREPEGERGRDQRERRAAGQRRARRPRSRTDEPPGARLRRRGQAVRSGRIRSRRTSPAIRTPARTLLGPGTLRLAELAGGRSGPALPGGDLPGDRRARRHLGPLADARAQGKRMLRVPTTAPAPSLTCPISSRSPSSQYPDRSTSDSTAAPRPSLSMPVTGGRECRSTSAPTLAPRARAYRLQPGPGQRGRAR